ncbi:unnamed protein product, partial [Prunus brigantina]
MVLTQYNKQIQVLRSDNGKEYVNVVLQTFLTAHGIIHQTTCPYTPQQNGVAERKNRHLLNVVRALLLEAHTPLSYWGEALVSAAYLINRVPSRTVEFQTPHHLLTSLISAPHSPNLLPHVFGCSFVCQLSSVRIPNSMQEALSDQNWQAAMEEELRSLKKNNTWKIVDLPAGKKPVGCRWIFTVKYLADGTIDRYKARLVAKGYSQKYGVDYTETFAPVAKINTVRVLLSLAANLDWPLHQFDVKNAFLHGELTEEVYMDLPPGYSYFLGIEVSRCKSGIFLSQRKYTLDLLQETGMSACQPVETPLEEGLKLGIDLNQVPADKGRYQRLVGRLMYLAHTRPDLAHVLGVVRSINDRRSTSGYFTFVGGNLVTWRSKKQNVVARSSAEAEYRGMALGICEILWIRNLLKDLGHLSPSPMKLFCDNQAARDIAHNPVQHDRTKHVEVDRFFIKEKIEGKIIEVPPIRT